MAMKMFCLSKESDEESLCCRVRVQASGDEEIRDGDPICCFLPLDWKGAEGW